MLCRTRSWRCIDRYWRAANYLSVGQIYLLDNPLLREPLALEHVKPRLLGHWGTTPGLNFIYVHLNRVIKEHDLDVDLHVRARPRRPRAWSPTRTSRAPTRELYPDISEDAEGMQKLFKQFSFPGGIPSHAAPETPGSIHEGGELGYALSHAFGAAFDNPDLLVACVIGDGEAETGPLATAWHSNKFLNPAHRRRRAADPPPERLQDREPDRSSRGSPREELESLFVGYGYKPYFVEGDDPPTMHRQMAETLDAGRRRDRRDPAATRARTATRERPRWPMIVLRTPKGWTGPKEVDGQKTEDYWRSHQVPLTRRRRRTRHTCSCSRSGCGATGPRSSSTRTARCCPS